MDWNREKRAVDSLSLSLMEEKDSGVRHAIKNKRGDTFCDCMKTTINTETVNNVVEARRLVERRRQPCEDPNKMAMAISQLGFIFAHASPHFKPWHSCHSGHPLRAFESAVLL